MDRWKATALASVSFSVGIICTIVIDAGVVGSARASDSNTYSGGSVVIRYDASGRACRRGKLVEWESAASEAARHVWLDRDASESERVEAKRVYDGFQDLVRARPSCSCPPGWRFAGWVNLPNHMTSAPLTVDPGTVACVGG